MELQILFNALSKAIMISLVQGLIIYIFVKMALSFFTTLTASQRYRILYSALMIMFGSFVYTLANTYAGLQRDLSRYSDLVIAGPGFTASEPAKVEWSVSEIVGWLYLAGIAAHLIYIFGGIYQIQRLRRSAFRDSVWEYRLAELKDRLNIRAQVSLRLSPKMLVPFTAGCLRPVIVLPIAMINQLSPAQVEAILLHELAHIKRADYFFNVIQKFIESALFFNPFMWILSREIRIEREFSCDDLVMGEKQDPLLYAHALLRVAESNLSLCRSGISLSGPGKFTLLTRIKRLHDMKTITSNPGSALMGFVGLILAGVSIAWVAPQKPVVKPEIARLEWITTDTLSKLSLLMAPSPPPAPLNNEIPVLQLSRMEPVPVLDTVLPKVKTMVFLSDTDKIRKYYESAEGKAHIEEMKKHAEKMKIHAKDMEAKFSSPEWKKHVEELKTHAMEMQKHQSSPEFKKMIEAAKLNAEEMSKKFNSPEWKASIAKIKVQGAEMQKQMESPEWKAAMEKMKLASQDMAKYYNSPEWKASVEKMKLSGEEMKKYYDSPEWKAAIAKMKSSTLEMQKQFESKEWKQQVEQMKIQAEKIQKESEVLEKTAEKDNN